MQVHRWKQIANLRKNPNCSQFLGEPESDSFSSSTMPPRPAKPVYTLAETLVLGPGETLAGEDGSWKDVDYYFVQCRKDPNLWSLIIEIYRGLRGTGWDQ